ncbi:MAG: helix-turn-helix transcriptional regulator [Tannerellaceae bacterium]|nr:helix-turn-helix transcriptional regulator [Tannerellaceae bacterium]
MKLLYVKEHITCRNYVSDFHVGFQYNEMEAGLTIEKGDKYYNYMIFLLEGEMKISNSQMTTRSCQGGEMFFIGRDLSYSIQTKTDVKFLLLAFDNPISFGTDLTVEDLQPYHSEEFRFTILPMCEGMLVVANTIKFYMHHKIQCKHLHVAKQQEVFMVLSAFYRREELAALFNPVLDNNVDFKSFVMNNYQDVKTVEELARLCNSSVRSLTRKFHDHFGDSPYSWILKQRSRHIKTRIADPKIPFGDIISEFGFSSPAHFTSFCKKYFGDTPSRLRKKQIEKSLIKKVAN